MRVATQSLITEATTWWRAVVSEYRDEPFTILSRSACPDEWDPPGGEAAAHTLSRSRFECIADFDLFPSDGYSGRARLLSLVAHETTHVLLDRAKPRLEPVESIPRTDSDRKLYQFVVTEAAPWFAHEAKFIHLLLHVSYRSRMRMFPMVPTAAGEQYGLSDISVYGRLLRAELESRRHEPIAEIAAGPVAGVCSFVFEQDCRLWREQRDQQEQSERKELQYA